MAVVRTTMGPWRTTWSSATGSSSTDRARRVPGRRRGGRRSHRQDRPDRASRARSTSTPRACVGHPRLHRRAHALRRADLLGRAGDQLVLARRDDRGDGQLRVHPRAGRRPTKPPLVVRNLERAEDISGVALAEGIDWSWTTLPRVPRHGRPAARRASTTPPLFGHSAVRTHVMGERAFEEEATDDDLRAMEAQLREGLAAGAAGFSTSRTQAPPDLRRPSGRVAPRGVERGRPPRARRGRRGWRRVPVRRGPPARATTRSPRAQRADRPGRRDRRDVHRSRR